MTLIDLFSQQYQYEEGHAGVLTLRRKTAQSLGIFGKGKTTGEAPFRTVRESINDVMQHARSVCGPCTRFHVVEAIHMAAEMQFRADSNRRRGK